LADPVEGLRKILALERTKKYTDSAVVGGLDGYLHRFLRQSRVPASHRFARVLHSLPPGGYRSLHPVQRRRVVEELLTALESGIPCSPENRDITAGPPLRVVSRSASAAPAAGKRAPAATPVAGALDSPISIFKGAGRTAQARLASRLGIRTVRDLLFHFPSRYHDYSQVRPVSEVRAGEEQTVVADVWSCNPGTVGRRKVTEALVGDRSGTMRVIWWSGHLMARRIRPGMSVALSGKVTAFRGRLQMENPEAEPLEQDSLNTRRLVPVYPSTEGVDQRALRSWVRQAVDHFAARLHETLPPALLTSHRLPPVAEALRQIHFPDSQEKADIARRRFAFEELLQVELGVVRRRREWQAAGGAPRIEMPPALREGFIGSLPFELTPAQARAMDAVLAGIAGEVPMNRLLEGDVGSGKTVVAAAALLAAVAAGYQGAIMAPTEILAEQHFRTFTGLLQPGAAGQPGDVWFQETGPGFVALHPPYFGRPVRVALLTGSLRGTEKSAAQAAIAAGQADIAVGTHALVQEGVGFPKLGLVAVDEQHRFGVEQRAALREKGRSPHVLVMTATPIPRTLALTVYGDLDVTVIDEMPPGRPPVKTWRVTPQQRPHAYRFLRNKAGEGRQAYIIFPLVEESEAVAARAAVQEYERLSREVFPGLKLGLLHGRMAPGEKDAVMRAFRDGGLDVLVSTAVVEVGVDVPNATVILIEGADRFGLAQLHQFRGRVRRSSEQAYCFLVSDSTSPEALERLQIMETVDNGFELAEHDLRLRGPGEYFGTRQSGMPDLKVASLTDVKLIEEARQAATALLDEDPELSRPEYAPLREQVQRLWSRVTAEAS
jgi:ATP-dependent DNA helicase RecG